MTHIICMRTIIVIHAIKNYRRVVGYRTVCSTTYVKLLAAENDLCTRTASHVTWPRGTGIYGKGFDLFRGLGKPVSYKQIRLLHWMQVRCRVNGALRPIHTVIINVT